MHTRTDKMSKTRRRLTFGKQLRQVYHRDANVERRLARHSHLDRMRLGRTQWKARYADVYDKQGSIVASRYLGHFIVVR